MAKRATCSCPRAGVEAVSLSVRVSRFCGPRPGPRGWGMQVESEPKQHAAGASPARHAAAPELGSPPEPVTFPADRRLTRVEGVAEYAFRHYQAQIYRYLRRWTAHSDQAEELTQ